MGRLKDKWDGMCARCSRLKTDAATMLSRTSLLTSLIKRSPHVLVVPMMLLCLMVALGCWGVKTAVDRTIQLQRNTAAVDADGASQALQLAIQRATLPLSQLAEIIRLMPEAQLLDKQFPIAAPSIGLGAAPGSMWFFANPGGPTRHAYPLTGASRGASSLIGVNFLLPPFKEITLQAIRERNMSLQGPLLIGNMTLMCSIYQPIFFSNMSANNTWDYKFNERLCPPGLCYNNQTRTRWWGGVGLMLDAMQLFGPDGPLSMLSRKGYQFRLWHPPVPGFVANVLQSVSLSGGAGIKIDTAVQAQESGEVVDGLTPMLILNQSNKEPEDAIAVSLPVISQTWELHVWKTSWVPSWMLPLLAVVVLGALLLSLLVFSTLCSWAEHRELLHSLLPKETIARMRHEAKWAATDGHEAIKTVRMETPAELMLRIIEDCITGRSPDLPLLLSVRDALHRSADVYRPSEKQMRLRMQEQAGMDDDVRHALTTQLMGATQSPFNHLRRDTYGMDHYKLGPDSDAEGTDTISCQGIRTSTLGSFVVRSVRYESCADEDNVVTSRQASEQSKLAEAQAVTERRTIMNRIAGKLNQQTQTSHENHAILSLQSDVREKMDITLVNWLLLDPEVLSNVQTAGGRPAPFNTRASLTPVGVDAQPASPQQADNAAEAMAVVLRPLLTQLEQVLVTSEDWTFDAYALEEASHGRPLSCLGFWLLHTTGLKGWAHMSSKKLIRFLERVEAGYEDNPYHNKRHAADVLQSVHVIMHRSGLMPGFADQLALLGCYLSAMVHDLEHVGCTNDFLVNSSDELAIRYNDRSPMENHHLAAAWTLLKTKECNILSGLPASDVSKLRKLMIDLVLATDMKQHFAIQGQFDTMARQAHEQATSDPESGTKQTTGHSERLGHAEKGKVNADFKPVNEQDQLLSLQMMLKCADIGSLSAPLPVYLKWVSALEAEMFLQGDEEKALGIPISPLCDRTKEGVTKAQIGFFDFVGLPLFKSFCQRFTGALPLLTGVLNNHAHWKTPAASAN